MGETRFSLNLAFSLVFLISTPLSRASDHVPVLIWGGDSVSTNLDDSSNIISQNVFQANLKGKINSNPVLLFSKNELCVENITQLGREEWKSLGPHQFFAAVESPLIAFENLFSDNKTLKQDVDVNQIPAGHLKIKEVENLDDIFQIFKKFNESSPNLIAALAGNTCMYTKSDRIRREAPNGTGARKAFIYKSRMLLTADIAPVLQVHDTKHILDVWNEKKVTGEGNIKSPLVFTIQMSDGSSSNGPFNELFDFSVQVRTSRYYTLNNITFKGKEEKPVVLLPNMDINFPFNFSYHCTPNVIFRAENYSLTFTNIQIQIDSQDGDFGDVYDCVGFMSIPIWAGIFVTAILAFIMIWGIIFIMDIRSMDRFDDPKGKTITISASE